MEYSYLKHIFYSLKKWTEELETQLDKLKKIDALKAEIESMKVKESNFKEKKIYCSNCNAELKPGSKFCTKSPRCNYDCIKKS